MNKIKKFVKSHKKTLTTIVATSVATATIVHIAMARSEVEIDLDELDKYNAETEDGTYRIKSVVINPKKYKF